MKKKAGAIERDKTDIVENGSALVISETSANLRKAVESIAIKPHAGKLTLLTRKINNVLLASAQEQGIDKSTYRMPLSGLCGLVDYDSSNLVIVKDQLRKMASTSVEWSVGVKGSRRWGITNLINVEIIEEGQRCSIEWDYPVKLKSRLLSPDTYARLSLQLQNSFRSAAALALYEICVRYETNIDGLTMRMPWPEWRPRLTGVPDGEDGAYTQYKYFKRDVLRPAVEEVSAITNLDVELLEYKLGRSVSDIQFRVKKKVQAALGLDEPNLLDLSLVTRIISIGFSQAQAEKIYSDTDDEARLRSVLDYVEKRFKQSGKPVANPQGYFRTALAQGYGVQSSTAAAEDKEKKKSLGAPAPAKGANAAAKLTEVLSKTWWLEQRKAAREQFDNLPPDEQQVVLDAFETGEPSLSHMRKAWQSKGLKDRACAVVFATWLTRELAEPSEVELLQYGLTHGLISASV